MLCCLTEGAPLLLDRGSGRRIFPANFVEELQVPVACNARKRSNDDVEEVKL